ncbi:MAG: tRNA preQ1(34) S-adenosylmethionine ribosyltransferase-isomerase QueA [Synergistaceae bacterium]|nr:tRNA preQ1(34) S-adenosylmethionine ribosyltransferase-isomerase QueA [Synergistaceae bacterium]
MADSPSDPPTGYDIESYAWDIPEALIAQNPTDKRDNSRLMRVSRAQGDIDHRHFSDLPSLLRSGDLLVLNDTRVFRARVPAKKIPGGASVEIFFLSPTGDPNVWNALVRPGRRLPPGASVELPDGRIIDIVDRLDDSTRLVRIPRDISSQELFENYGQIPLPPYIKSSAEDDERYQTVYSDRLKNRSVAAPTAGLHFTQNLLDELKCNGIDHEFITLDVGIGTFRPIKTRDIRDHVMHSEKCAIEPRAADRINSARADGRRIVAVGTTVARTLESFAEDSGYLRSGERTTDIFISPGYRFKVPDALITNFHLPRSTLLLLVSAFAGYELMMSAYAEAVDKEYRFFSFGDVMLIE